MAPRPRPPVVDCVGIVEGVDDCRPLLGDDRSSSGGHYAKLCMATRFRLSRFSQAAFRWLFVWASLPLKKRPLGTAGVRGSGCLALAVGIECPATGR